ncbi:nucleoside/nucleotide kinase family protein (plasmid) [Bartonella sp. HY329]|uniref:nucleoside/nucleotide kinase family protein n=1 Tax=unclassified Bartonella TaxID=2645622 RepID=UPI0021C8C737|nr:MULTISPECIES: nucleoside/nucleotide kinase family protein [unclassified Bartonella]UXM96645.1 nucleoside/nucleotide kinase family protein [Bartonella sp. HY329]UXN10968.1 nucleoside/nucleotide kinase family protein [Bartonella sp. HY328]
MDKITKNAAKIADIARQKLAENNGQRVLIAVAGAPGSGKSTLSEHAIDLLNAGETGYAALLPMDGYHYDDSVLNKMGRRAFKGAIDTFDAHGLRHMVQRLKANEDDTIAIPVFDRSIEIARAGGRLISQSTKIIICEGNYLLALQSPWQRLKPLFDYTIFVEVELSDLRQRLQQRWRSLGVDEEEVTRKVEENDLPNGLSIIANSARPDLYLKNSD